MSKNNFMQEDQIEKKMGLWMLFKKMWPYLRRHPWQLTFIIVCILLLAASARLIPNLIGYAIDHGLKERNWDLFSQLAWIYLALEVSKTFFNFLHIYLFQRYGNRILYYIRDDLFRHAEGLSLQFFNKNPSGRIVTRLTNDVMSLGELFTDGIISVFTCLIMIIATTTAMFMISAKLALVTIFTTPLFLYVAYQISRHITNILRDQKKRLAKINSFLAENLNGIRIVQLYNRVGRNQGLFHHLSNEYGNVNIKSIRHYAMLQPVLNLLNAVLITSALYFSGLLASQETIAIGSLVAFLMHTQDFLPPIREILEKYQQFQNSLTSAERVFILFDETTEESEKKSEYIHDKFNGHIRFENLSFQYESHLPFVLKNIQLEILPGESIALVGRTGSGKSTLISLLQRLYNPPDKTVFIDNFPIEEIPRQTLRQNIGVVQQENHIFRGTIIENITLSDSKVTEQNAIDACARIGYLDHLKNTNRSLQSQVEEKGANLSVGERQLIAFARIMAFDPDILVLDEATSNIDSETEQLLQKATMEIMKGRTSLIVAHRLSTVQDCDRIIVLDHGEIIESGSHEKLMQARGQYYQLASAGLKSTLTEASAAGTAEP